MNNQTWGGLSNGSRNPIEQALDNIFAVKDLLRASRESLGQIRLEYLIVLTGEGSHLDWSASDIDDNHIRDHAST
jgi:hypothetical protein